MSSVLCIGEALIAFTPVHGADLQHAQLFEASVAGAEANVAIALAGLRTSVAWAGLLGADPFGARVLETLASRGIATDFARVLPDASTGIYVKPGDGGAAHYYRRGSAGSRLRPADVDVWAEAAEPRLVHVTGVTAQASELGLTTLQHIVEARPFGASIVSFDVNHRTALANLATADDLLRLASASDIVFVGRDESARLWNTTSAEQVRSILPQPRWLVVKDADREAVEFHDDIVVYSPAPRVDVIEPTGAGDAFAAGWIGTFLDGGCAEERLAAGHDCARRVLRSRKDHFELEASPDAVS